MKKKEIQEKDFRVHKDSFQDINSEFRNFSQFQNSQEYQNAIKAKALLSDQWDTNSESLRETLMSTYKMSTEDVNQCFRNLTNSKDVDVHENVYNHTVKFRKR